MNRQSGRWRYKQRRQLKSERAARGKGGTNQQRHVQINLAPSPPTQRREEDEDAVCYGSTSQVPDLHFLRNYLPLPIYRHIASFLSMFKLMVIGLIIIGRDPFALFGIQAPGIWEWGQGNKIYACMMVFFFSNMIENQLMSTGAFEITLNDVPVWSKLESGHLPSMQQLVQILDNEMKMNVHMNTRPHHHS
ncbi:hypothetical protein Q5P01_022448 [Channa striata]|uniref:Selenoprotein T n=1 Tax=Channa striata TaxID=64152 RepID=A0AA88IX78_CHASR|nr:hypothetical protein Q5P01_022448 [Channa striata]